MDIFSSLTNLPDQILAFIAPKTPPGSAIFIILVSLGITLFSVALSRKMIDIDKLKRYTREMREYNSLKMKSLRSQDRRLMKKVDDNKERFTKIQSELMFMRMKPMLIQMLPLIIVFIVMNTYFSANSALVAVIPFQLPTSIILFIIGEPVSALTSASPFTALGQISSQIYIPNYVGWYFACSLTFGAVIQKLAGLAPD